MSAREKVRRYVCATCGAKRPAAEMSYSRHTGNRYCIGQHKRKVRR